MELIEREREHLASLLSRFYESRFTVYNDRLILRMYQGGLAHLAPGMYTDEQAFELLTTAVNQAAANTKEADLFRTLVESGAAEK